MTVIRFPGHTNSEGQEIVGEGYKIPTESVLDGAKKAGLKYALILGETEDGNWYFASSNGDNGALLMAMEIFKGVLLGYIDLSED